MVSRWHRRGWRDVDEPPFKILGYDFAPTAAPPLIESCFPSPGNPETPSGRRASPDARSSCATIPRGATRTSPTLRAAPGPAFRECCAGSAPTIMSELLPAPAIALRLAANALWRSQTYL